VEGKHPTVAQFKTTILYKTSAVIGGRRLQVEGILKIDSHTGETGILIGETDEIRQRINQYIHG
jgi:hypothetical protein